MWTATRYLLVGSVVLASAACRDSSTAPGAFQAASVRELPDVTILVDAEAAPGGDGTPHAPFARIVDALDAGRALAAGREVTIVVKPGSYTAEPRPLVFDYPVHLKGPTVLLRDADGIATGAVQSAATIRGIPASVPMISLTGAGVAIRGLRLDGGGTVGIGIAVDESVAFRLEDLFVSNFASGIVVSASVGKIEGSYVGSPTITGVALNGGNTAHPADVHFVRNRVVGYMDGGLALQGASDPLLPREAFHTLKATVRGNVLSTSMSSAGPSNPYGVRFNVVNGNFTTRTSGFITARVMDNLVHGDHRYPLIISGGQVPRLAAVDWSGGLDLDFKDNRWIAAPGAVTEARAIITFTSSRMGIAPFWQELAVSTEYLERATYRIKHHGELDACGGEYSFDCHVDHPEVEPCDGRVLGNVLELKGLKGPLPYRTFVPDVCPTVRGQLSSSRAPVARASKSAALATA
jgi:hypothetical protein